MNNFRPLQLPMTYQDAADHGRIILRDGTTATLRLSTREDYKAIRDFYQRLSPASRKMRFFSEAKPGEDVIESMCDSSNPARCMTLLIWRIIEGTNRIIATGSYIAENETTAEFAVAVDDAQHGKGLGGTILERLAVLAVSHGFTRFNAYTHMNNSSMLDIFRHSGFELTEQPEEGMVSVTFSVLPDEKNVSHSLQRDRLFTKASIRPFFHPEAVAVINDSTDSKGPGFHILQHLLENKYAGEIYAVNPGEDHAGGVHVLQSAEDLPDGIDLVIIAVPQQEVEQTVDACAKRNARALVITTTGYAETGREGRERQEELLGKVRGYGMRLLGPNSLGILNTDLALNLNASLSQHYPRRGRIAVSSQSGALGMALLQIAAQRNIGLSMFASMGNKADVTGNDLLYYWEDDSTTDVILLYLESFGNPQRFGRIAREVSRRKPIICMKSGSYRSTREEHAVEALFEQAGVVRVRTIEDMFDTAALLGHQPLPGGKRVSIITNSRGAGVLCADACVSSGLEIAYLSPQEKKELKSHLPPGASLEGIIDLSSESTPAHYGTAIQAALDSTDSDSLIILYTPLVAAPAEPVLDALTHALSGKLKTVLTVMMTNNSASSVLHHRGAAIPCYQFPEKAAHTLAAANRYRAWREAPPGIIPDFNDIDLGRIRKLVRSYDNRDPEGWLKEVAVRNLLQSSAIPYRAAENIPGERFDIIISQHELFGSVMSFGRAGISSDETVRRLYRMIPLTDRDAAALGRTVYHADESTPAFEDLLLRLSFVAEGIPDIDLLEINILLNNEIHILQSRVKICV